MPLLDLYMIDTGTSTCLGVWDIQEETDIFRSKIELFPEERDEISGLGERKKLEWFCSRYLLYLMLDHEKRGACLKDEFGKPYLKGSDFYISISHSNGRTAVLVSRVKVGVDIQVIVSKINRISGKFLSEMERNTLPEGDNTLAYHFYWGAKEAMYKIYGKKELDFKQHLFVEPFIFQDDRVLTHGKIQKGQETIKCQLEGWVQENFVLVRALEVKD